jgi:hypothetical protein
MMNTINCQSDNLVNSVTSRANVRGIWAFGSQLYTKTSLAWFRAHVRCPTFQDKKQCGSFTNHRKHTLNRAEYRRISMEKRVTETPCMT